MFRNEDIVYSIRDISSIRDEIIIKPGAEGIICDVICDDIEELFYEVEFVFGNTSIKAIARAHQISKNGPFLN